MKNGGWEYRDAPASRHAGMAALDFYLGEYSHSTRAEWEGRFLAGEIFLNGSRAKAADVLEKGDVLLWRRPPWEEPPPPRYRIVYEDDDILAVDKPAGLPVVPGGGFLECTLTSCLEKERPSSKIVPAHRLNRGASGLVLFTKNDASRREMARQFRENTAGGVPMMEKVYYAISKTSGRYAPGDKLEADSPIGPVSHPKLGRVYAASGSGKPSRTILEIVSSSRKFSLWRASLVTGRPHQIRIHLASIGEPLLGDTLYREGGVPSWCAFPGDGGFYLKSETMSFAHPATGKRTTISLVPGEKTPESLFSLSREDIEGMF